MCPADDIKFEELNGKNEHVDTPEQPNGSLREIGAESEVRGGPEAPDDCIDEATDNKR